MVYGDMDLHLGPRPARGDAWVRVWNEHFQPSLRRALMRDDFSSLESKSAESSAAGRRH